MNTWVMNDIPNSEKKASELVKWVLFQKIKREEPLRPSWDKEPGKRERLSWRGRQGLKYSVGFLLTYPNHVKWDIIYKIYKMIFQWGKQAKGVCQNVCEASQAPQIKAHLYLKKKKMYLYAFIDVLSSILHAKPTLQLIIPNSNTFYLYTKGRAVKNG